MKNPFTAEAGETSLRYYGWLAVGLTFLTMATGGAVVGTFSVFYVAFLEEFGWSRGDTALGFSFSMVTFALSAGAIGSLIDRWGPRAVIPCGVAVLGAGLALMSTVDSLAELYIYYGVVVALGITLIGFVPTSTVVSRWFRRRRATAMGLALSGRSFGGMLLVPFSAYLIGAYGWRGAYLILAAGIALPLLPLTAALHRRPPLPAEERSLAPGSPPEEGLWGPAFWFVFTAGLLHGVGFSIVGLHQVAHLVDAGVGAMTAASLMGALAALRTLGGMAGGWCGDRLGRTRTYFISSAAGLAGVFLLMNVNAERWLLAYLYVVFLGLGDGARGITFLSIKADLFPARSFGRILGYSQIGSGLAAAAGPWLAGYIYDVLGSYRYAFWLVVIVDVLSLATVAAAAVRGGTGARRREAA
ncbi:MAG: MFS transporter [Candidatus Tectomicrobia bacterium]|uniref:MFS transporter n=1 Tax=Tectimicrobiota bacterium TaxID=2528274 RepID=A0A932I140_UNCTE|nr:MFS transporter [Candidatus Tectomicrobia bacterium]